MISGSPLAPGRARPVKLQQGTAAPRRAPRNLSPFFVVKAKGSRMSLFFFCKPLRLSLAPHRPLISLVLGEAPAVSTRLGLELRAGKGGGAVGGEKKVSLL